MGARPSRLGATDAPGPNRGPAAQAHPFIGGFLLEAGRRVEANERQSLEPMRRPPSAKSRLRNWTTAGSSGGSSGRCTKACGRPTDALASCATWRQSSRRPRVFAHRYPDPVGEPGPWRDRPEPAVHRKTRAGRGRSRPRRGEEESGPGSIRRGRVASAAGPLLDGAGHPDRQDYSCAAPRSTPSAQ
jgi:hypothetical protein